MNVTHYPMLNLPDQRQIIQTLLTRFPVVRFMNWQQTNRLAHHKRPIIREWADLPQADDDWEYTGGPRADFRSVPLDVIIDYANEMNVRAWLNVPHAASDTLIEQMVSHIIARCAYRPIIEYSNELWNGLFVQRAHVTEMGLAAGLSEHVWEAPLLYQAAQTRKIKAIAGDGADVVIGGQFFNPNIADILLAAVGDGADAFAVAPYVGRKQRALDAETGAPKSADQLYLEIDDEIDGEIADLIAQFIAKTDAHGIELYAYEGGLHQAAQNTTPEAYLAERQTFVTFNRSADAGYATDALWKQWLIQGGTIACPYSLCTIYEHKYNGQLEANWFGHTELYGNEIRIWDKFAGTEIVQR